MKEKLLSIASVFTAIFAALCWSGGLILASLGLGTIGVTYFSGLTKYKPLFIILTAILLYWSYSIIEKKNSNRITRIIFWISAVLAILMAYLPTILRFFQR